MENVTGLLEYSVSVDCPECGADLDLETFDDDEGELGRALFGKVGEPARWEEFEVVYTCPECCEKFKLTKIEY